MSCTENESGPFVVFFLPAVVGCLTILLARRWASAQVSNTSSTAVSRRRKIIKDPPIKRPLPTITCKMVAPGSKKSSGIAKKGTIPTCETDINGKHIGRPRLPTVVPNTTTNGKSETPQPPKHIPFPYVPQDGELLFETMSLMFTLVATALQFLNMYRTAWWLPSSLENQAMHFYLINPHLVAFIVTLLSRRFLFSFSVAVLRCFVAPKVMPHATIAARMFILGVEYGALAYCGFFLTMKHSFVQNCLLFYPCIIYVILFGFKSGPFLELGHTEAPMHSCSHEPAQVRAEVEVLRLDFNARVKKILFNSIIGAYYSSFIPCCFVQPYVHYEILPAAQQVCLVWGALCGRYTAHLLPATVADTCHRAAHHLGRWAPLHPPDPLGDHSEVQPWSGARYWWLGARVRHGGSTYIAGTTVVAAEPDNAHHLRFFSVFSNPPALLCLLLCLQLSLVLLQLCLLFSSLAWNNFLAIVILLFINYYTLFKMTRDYFIAWRVYKAENFIFDKNGIQIPVS
ncbi:transmembrane protein 39A [Epargyreus clarus]|uniref:transmembrane protein 39A n=1 Tax=Epargyreus clarus TaxID=520877 RepID=UPI003C2B9378